MKHRTTVRNREVLLLYRFRDTEIGRQLRAVAARMGIMCKVVEEEQTEETLGALLKLPGFASGSGSGKSGASEQDNASVQNDKADRPEPKPELTRQVMIMHGFTNQRLGEFLQNMRKAEIEAYREQASRKSDFERAERTRWTERLKRFRLFRNSLQERGRRAFWQRP